MPSGASGVLLKFKGSSKSLYADSVGSRLEVRSMLSISWVCSANFSHSWIG